jgi:hypothetical protein
MLPWLFSVLLVVNIGVAIWGYQREQSQTPKPPPVPAAPHKILLLPKKGSEPFSVAPSPSAANAEGASPEASPAPPPATQN